MNKQRKLTWLERKQIEKVAFDHPFFDVPGRVLSRKDAKEIIRSVENRKTGTQIVTEAYAKLGVSYSASIDEHPSLLENLKEIFSVPAIRRVGIIAIAVILIVVFFAATPVGRTIAESVIRYFVTLFDDGEVVFSKNDRDPALIPVDSVNEIDDIEDEQDESDDTEMYIYLDSFDSFTEATGRIPVILPFSYKEIYYIHEPDIDFLQLFSTYDTPKGKIVTYQIWDVSDAFSFSLTGYTKYDTDEHIYFSIEENGNVYCKKVLEDSIFTISSESTYTLDDLVNLIKDK